LKQVKKKEKSRMKQTNNLAGHLIHKKKGKKREWFDMSLQ
jgi:hypothetical protein